MTYDVPVKLFSLHLVVMSLLLLAPERTRLLNVFLSEPRGSASTRKRHSSGVRSSGEWSSAFSSRSACGWSTPASAAVCQAALEVWIGCAETAALRHLGHRNDGHRWSGPISPDDRLRPLATRRHLHSHCYVLSAHGRYVCPLSRGLRCGRWHGDAFESRSCGNASRECARQRGGPARLTSRRRPSS